MVIEVPKIVPCVLRHSIQKAPRRGYLRFLPTLGILLDSMLYILSTSILYLVILLVSKHVVTLSHARKEGRRDP